MKKKDFINLAEAARLVGARVYLIEKVEVDYTTPILNLIKTFAPGTYDYHRSLLCKADVEGKNKISDFIAICWPNDSDGGLKKAQNWALKRNLKTTNVRELVSICKNWFYIFEDLSLDIIKLVSTDLLKNKAFFAQIEGTTDPSISLANIQEMASGDFWFVFKLE